MQISNPTYTHMSYQRAMGWQGSPHLPRLPSSDSLPQSIHGLLFSSHRPGNPINYSEEHIAVEPLSREISQGVTG